MPEKMHCARAALASGRGRKKKSKKVEITTELQEESSCRGEIKKGASYVMVKPSNLCLYKFETLRNPFSSSHTPRHTH